MIPRNPLPCLSDDIEAGFREADIILENTYRTGKVHQGYIEPFAAVASADADGVIIGSKIIKIIEDNLDNNEKTLSEIKKFIEEIKAAL